VVDAKQIITWEKRIEVGGHIVREGNAFGEWMKKRHLRGEKVKQTKGKNFHRIKGREDPKRQIKAEPKSLTHAKMTKDSR